MDETIKLETSLFDTLVDNSVELGGEVGELTVDQFIDNEFLKEIPFFSIFYKTVKAVHGLREGLFAMKVYKFIKDLDGIKRENRNRFVVNILANHKEKIKVGTTLMMILDKLDELNKTQLLANIFVAYVRSEITVTEFCHMCSIVQWAFIDHLLQFGKMEKYSDLDVDTTSSLASVGLMMPFVNDIKSMYGSSVLIEENDYMINYVVSKIGGKFRKYAFAPLP